MKVATFNGCKVYNLSMGKTMPAWLSENKKRAMAKDEEYRRRLELMQDFEMPTASQCIKMTADGEHIIVTGTYPPVVKCFTTSDLAMKFQRGLTCEVVAMETLSENYGKLVFLQADRTLSFHAPYGTHYNIRIPKFGRDIAYNWDNCDLYVAASGNEIYRLNLETGQFKEPFQTNMTGCNKIHVNPVHSLICCGGEGLLCEFWDPRSRKAVSKVRIDQVASSSNAVADTTAVRFDSDGLTLAVGTSTGYTFLYDIRSSVPLYCKEHQYGLPIVDISFHNSSRMVMSTDKKICKIWERDDPTRGKILTNVEAPADINAVLPISDRRGPTGLVMFAGEQSRVMTYFIPQLGPAPRWCSFLEGITEELEEEAGQNVYEDFKFVSRQELDELGAAGLIGSTMLKSYMHGFFMPMKLYTKLRAVSKPFEYEEYRKRKVQEEIEKRREKRIAPLKRLKLAKLGPKVNAALAEKLMQKGKKGTKADAANLTQTSAKSLVDERFSSLFEREEFEVDETAEEYRLRNPTLSTGKKGNNSDSEDDLKGVYQAVEDDEPAEDDDDDDDNFDDVYEEADDNEVYEEDSEDLDSIRYDTGKRKKSKQGGSNKKADQEEEVGPIERLSRKIQQKKEEARRTSSGSSLKKPPSSSTAKSSSPRPLSDGKKKKAGSGARMYELAEGVASSSALFGHSQQTKSARQDEKRRLSQPIAERLKSSGGSSADGRKSGEPAAKMRYMRDKATGFVRELTYVPEDRNRKGGKDSFDGDTKSSSGRNSSSTKVRKQGNSRFPKK